MERRFLYASVTTMSREKLSNINTVSVTILNGIMNVEGGKRSGKIRCQNVKNFLKTIIVENVVQNKVEIKSNDTVHV